MTDSGYVYTTSGGESFDSVALEVYGDEKYAADLIRANTEYWDVCVFSGGEVLRLPVIETAMEAAAPWKE